MRLVLASQSPRRRELMNLLGHPFESTVSGVDEFSVSGETPEEHVRRLSLMKAQDIAGTYDDSIIIGSDTIVAIDDVILEKPLSRNEAVTMLMQLQGRTHTVHTGFALVDSADGRSLTGVESTRVTMRPFDTITAKRYIATNEPMDKAGAYGIQGYGAVLIEGVEGCYFTVMGLPVARLMEALEDFSGGEIGYFGTINK